MMGWLQGGKNLKEAPAYGADVLRLWVASVDYNSDVLIGDRILSQVLLNPMLLVITNHCHRLIIPCCIHSSALGRLFSRFPAVSKPSHSCIGYLQPGVWSVM